VSGGALHRLARLNPLSLVLGPVFQKEVRVAGRKRSTYWARGLCALALVGFAALLFAGLRSDLSFQSPAEQLQRVQTLAPRMTIGITIFQFAILVLAAPALTAGAISDERRSRTLSALMTTPLSAAQIVLGKLAGSLVQLLILGLLAAPVLLALRVFGGVDARVIAWTTAVTLSVALLGASLGIMYSVWHTRGASAVLFALFTLAIFVAGPMTIATGMAIQSGGPPPLRTAVTCAPFVLVALLDQLSGGSLGIGAMVPFFAAINVAYNLILAAAVLTVAIITLRRVMRADGVLPAPALGTSSDAGGPPDQSRYRRARRERDVPDRPVLWREIHRPMLRTGRRRLVMRGWALVLLTPVPIGMGLLISTAAFGDERSTGALGLVLVAAIVSAGIFGVGLVRFRSRLAVPIPSMLTLLMAIVLAMVAFLYARFGFSEIGVHGSIAIIGVLAVLFQSAVAGTGSIAGEREARTWATLLTTRIGPREILMGKFLGALRPVALVAAIPAIHFILAAALGWIHPIFLPIYALALIGPAVLLTGTGVLLSLVLRRSTTATVLNLSLGAVLWIGLPVSVAAFGSMFDLYAGGSYARLFNATILMNPVAQVGMSIDTAFLEQRYMDARLIFDLPVGQIRWGPFLASIATADLAYTALGMGAVFLGIKTFARFARRGL